MGRVGHVPRRATELSVLRSAGSWSSRRGSSVVELVVVVGCAESVVVVFSANKCNGERGRQRGDGVVGMGGLVWRSRPEFVYPSTRADRSDVRR
jgi:hypothetical protein